ncbi:unnamed protein product [Phaeothamnion confervicola]
MFPGLTSAAVSVHGHSASAAQIERDFGIAGLLVVPWRSLMDPAFADIVLFPRANSEHIPKLDTIPELASYLGGAGHHECVSARRRTKKAVHGTLDMSEDEEE